jgi:hypothetical protein
MEEFFCFGCLIRAEIMPAKGADGTGRPAPSVRGG